MSQPPLQTKRDIQGILDGIGTRPQKRHGQNFLIDGNLMRKLLDCAELQPGDTVLEVGGGTGGLSEQLAAAVGQLIVVEIDSVLGPLLVRRFAEWPHVTVLTEDVLTNKNNIASGVLETLAAATPDGGTYKLVANLPYNVATPLLMNLLTVQPRIERFCFTIQKEVADRTVAAAGGRDFGPLAIALQTVCKIERVAKLPPGAFWPAPKIESTMLRLDRKPHPFEAGDALPQFLSLIHAAFAHRRKTLRYNLARHLDESQLTAAAEIVDLTKRAEAVDLTSWIELGSQMCSQGPT